MAVLDSISSPAAPSLVDRPPYITLLGQRIDRLTRSSLLEWVKKLLTAGGRHQLVTANPIMLMAARQDPELTRAMNQASLVIPESSGVFWASEQLGTPLEEFLPGIDVFQALCAFARDTRRSVFLFGAAPGVAEQAAVTLCTRFPGLKIAGTQHGYYPKGEENAVVFRIHQAAPDFLFVALSVPGQEKWIFKNLSGLNAKIVMGVGGSYDVLSGRLRRAPVWMRELGIEWLFRTLQEPWRMKRLVHLPVFVWKILTSR